MFELDVLQRHNDEYKNFFNFLETHKEEIIKSSRAKHVEKFLEDNFEDKFYLVCEAAQKRKFAHFLKKITRM